MNFRTVFTNETVDKIKIFFLHVDLIEQERRIDLDHFLVLVRLHGINLFKIRIGGIVVHVVKSGTDQPDIAGQGSGKCCSSGNDLLLLKLFLDLGKADPLSSSS